MNQDTKNEFDVEEMSKQTGISVVLLKKTLSIPLEITCPVQTLQEAKEAYRKAPDKSDEKYLAYECWNKLSFVKLNSANSAIEALKVYKDDVSYDVKDLAQKKWEKLSNEELDSAKTIEELKAIYYSWNVEPMYGFKSFIEKWMGMTTTLEEIKEAYKELKESFLSNETLGIKKFATFYGWKE